MTQNTRQPYRPRSADWVLLFVVFLYFGGCAGLGAEVVGVWNNGNGFMIFLLGCFGGSALVLLKQIFYMLDYKHALLLNELARRQAKVGSEEAPAGETAQKMSTLHQK